MTRKKKNVRAPRDLAQTTIVLCKARNKQQFPCLLCLGITWSYITNNYQSSFNGIIRSITLMGTSRSHQTSPMNSQSLDMIAGTANLIIRDLWIESHLRHCKTNLMSPVEQGWSGVGNLHQIPIIDNSRYWRVTISISTTRRSLVRMIILWLLWMSEGGSRGKPLL